MNRRRCAEIRARSRCCGVSGKQYPTVASSRGRESKATTPRAAASEAQAEASLSE